MNSQTRRRARISHVVGGVVDHVDFQQDRRRRSVVMRHSISFVVAPTSVAPPQALPSSDVTTNEFAVQFDTTAMGCAGGGTGGVGIVGVGVRVALAQLARRRIEEWARRGCGLSRNQH